jgi:hypothetical protein
MRKIIIPVLLAAVLFAAGASAALAVATHYSRPDTVLIETRKNGDWKVRCHDLHYVSSNKLWAFGGCLKPYHIIK